MDEQARHLLRQQLRSSRDALSASAIREHSSAICDNVIPLLHDRKHIASYLAFGAEVDLSSLLPVFESNHQQCYVPVVLPEFNMAFAPIDKHTLINKNRYGIKEPQVERALYQRASDLDAVLVPLVGFDTQCNRMGMGGGYYDRCFAHRIQDHASPLLIGIAYELQCTDTVYTEAWDVPLDFVVTESRVIERQADR